MTATAYINQAARAAAAKRPLTLTMLGYAAAWQAQETAIMAARPAEATAACALCGDIYAKAGLAALDSDAVYERAVEHESLGDREAPFCRFCRERLESEYGQVERPDVYHIYDRGMYSTDR